MEMKNMSHRYDINKPRPKHGQKYSEYQVSQYDDPYLY